MKTALSTSRLARLATGTAVLALSLAACSGGITGGATPCGDYLNMSSANQEKVIRKFMEEKGDSNPAAGMVSLSQMSAVAYCSTVGTSTDPIRNIDGY